MKKQIALLIILAAATSPVITAGTVELEPKEMAPPPRITDNDHWYFNIGFPGWLAFVSGDIGLHGTTSNVDVGFDQILTNVDDIASIRSKSIYGRLGAYAIF